LEQAFVVIAWLALALAGLGWFTLWSQLRRLKRQSESLLKEAARRVAQAQAQNGLAANIDMLRGRLYALGAPQMLNGALHFGSTPVRGSTAIVDDVRTRFGGAATIFERDERISTNVMAADGSRAHGTKLEVGPAYERVLKQGKSYRGETMILSKPFLAVYEPVITDGKVVGILFAGVEDQTAGAAAHGGQTMA